VRLGAAHDDVVGRREALLLAAREALGATERGPGHSFGESAPSRAQPQIASRVLPRLSVGVVITNAGAGVWLDAAYDEHPGAEPFAGRVKQ